MEDRELVELIRKLDKVELEAFTIWMRADLSGESLRAATEKAEAFFLAHPGYERQAQVMRDYVEMLEREEGATA